MNICYLGQRSVETASYTISQALQTPGLPDVWGCHSEAEVLTVSWVMTSHRSVRINEYFRKSYSFPL